MQINENKHVVVVCVIVFRLLNIKTKQQSTKHNFKDFLIFIRSLTSPF